MGSLKTKTIRRNQIRKRSKPIIHGIVKALGKEKKRIVGNETIELIEKLSRSNITG